MNKILEKLEKQQLSDADFCYNFFLKNCNKPNTFFRMFVGTGYHTYLLYAKMKTGKIEIKMLKVKKNLYNKNKVRCLCKSKFVFNNEDCFVKFQNNGLVQSLIFVSDIAKSFNFNITNFSFKSSNEVNPADLFSRANYSISEIYNLKDLTHVKGIYNFLDYKTLFYDRFITHRCYTRINKYIGIVDNFMSEN